MSAIKDYILGFYDGPHATPKESGEGPVFLGIKNVTSDGRLDFSEIRHVSDAEFPKWTKRVTPKKDDIVFTYEASLHRYAIIPAGFHGCLGRRMALMRPDTTKVFPRFLHYYCLSSAWRKEAEASVTSGATVDRIPLTKVPDFKVDFPDLPTQERIAGILSAYDDLIENNRRRIALLEQAARLLYREWFVHFRFPGHETAKFVGGLPEGWESATILDLFDTSSGGTPSRKYESFYGGQINWLKTQELQNCFIFETDEKITDEALKRSSAKLFPENTVIVAMYGATIGQLGLLAKPSSTNQACCALLPKRNEHDFIFGYCLMEHSARSLKDRGQGAAQNNVSQTVIRGMEITIPSPAVLDEFNAALEANFLQRKNLQAQVRKLTKARDLLLPRLMDGRIPVKV